MNPLIKRLCWLLVLLFSPFSMAAVTVTDGYVAQKSADQSNGAAYMVIHNQGSSDITLVMVNSPVATKSNIYQFIERNGKKRKRLLNKGLLIKANSSVTLAPETLVIALMGSNQALNPGDMVKIRLNFDNNELLELDLPVK
ncbi:hypothetical protein VST7929_03103 [Vibrio stylophorae]|jgi:copper(I)-binding protein|uniref:Copper chaperone PCu(A)C n=1 Tax=Vibrio stylophorae TaxID=659351 RepID=A0ABN8E200_9VIBR|nr:copper chaperone PCu(A)C [Vibrio stylophorae]CAH0535536.1 hypothetical protein VST7929_03103 [Vibrio stylophorae]